MNIRPAALQDAPAIAKVHVASWRASYRGLIPDDVLDNLSVERRAGRWREILSDMPPAQCCFLAEEAGEVVGFASGGPVREQHPDCAGELYAIYLLPDYWGRGVGRQLTGAVAGHLQLQGIHSMLAWVLKDNHPARRFYEALNGEAAGEKEIEIGGTTLKEVAYGWEDTTSLTNGGANA